VAEAGQASLLSMLLQGAVLAYWSRENCVLAAVAVHIVLSLKPSYQLARVYFLLSIVQVAAGGFMLCCKLLQQS